MSIKAHIEWLNDSVPATHGTQPRWQKLFWEIVELTGEDYVWGGSSGEAVQTGNSIIADLFSYEEIRSADDWAVVSLDPATLADLLGEEAEKEWRGTVPVLTKKGEKPFKQDESMLLIVRKDDPMSAAYAAAMKGAVEADGQIASVATIELDCNLFSVEALKALSSQEETILFFSGYVDDEAAFAKLVKDTRTVSGAVLARRRK